MNQKFGRIIQLTIEKLIYLGGINEIIVVKLLQRIYQSKFRLDWEFSKIPPHFYNHRMGMAQFIFGDKDIGPYPYYRGFFSSQVIREGDRLLDIGSGDGFFTKRFFAKRCKSVDGIDIEPSAIQTAIHDNNARNITYHLLDAVKMEFPEKEYDVVVWDGAIGHFAPETIHVALEKILSVLSKDGIFVGSESLGIEGEDHLSRFMGLNDFGELFLKYFKFVEVCSNVYQISDSFTRHEAYWRCSNQPDRLQQLVWKKYYKE